MLQLLLWKHLFSMRNIIHKSAKVNHTFNHNNYYTFIKRRLKKEIFLRTCIVNFYLLFIWETCNETGDNGKTSLASIFNFRCAQQNTHTCVKQSGAKERRRRQNVCPARRKCNIRTCADLFSVFPLFFFLLARYAKLFIARIARARA